MVSPGTMAVTSISSWRRNTTLLLVRKIFVSSVINTSAKVPPFVACTSTRAPYLATIFPFTAPFSPAVNCCAPATDANVIPTNRMVQTLCVQRYVNFAVDDFIATPSIDINTPQVSFDPNGVPRVLIHMQPMRRGPELTTQERSACGSSVARHPLDNLSLIRCLAL